MRTKLVGLGAILLAGGAMACGSDSDTDSASTSASTATGSGGGVTSSSAGGMGGMDATGGMGGSGGDGGMGGSPPAWPTCEMQPANVPSRTIAEIWSEDPSMPTPVWVPGVYVTAVSASGCSAGSGCQIFVQQQETFPDIATGSQQAIKLFASPATANHFEGIAVGDQLDIYAHAWRYNVGGQNELLLQVAESLPGCAEVVGSGDPQPVSGLSLIDLTVPLYEEQMGPLLIQIDAVSGSANNPNQLFALWPAFLPGTQPLSEITSLSPYMLPNSQFTGLTPDLIYNFIHVVGVFSLFVPNDTPVVKYEVFYLRNMTDANIGGT